MTGRFAIRLTIGVLLARSVLAQSNIDPAHRFTWAENVGWLNWRPDSGYGVRVHDTYLSGHVWGENVGWLNFGSISSNFSAACVPK